MQRILLPSTSATSPPPITDFLERPLSRWRAPGVVFGARNVSLGHLVVRSMPSGSIMLLEDALTDKIRQVHSEIKCCSQRPDC